MSLNWERRVVLSRLTCLGSSLRQQLFFLVSIGNTFDKFAKETMEDSSMTIFSYYQAASNHYFFHSKYNSKPAKSLCSSVPFFLGSTKPNSLWFSLSFWKQNQFVFGLVLFFRTKPFCFWFGFSFKKVNRFIFVSVLVLKN